MLRERTSENGATGARIMNRYGVLVSTIAIAFSVMTTSTRAESKKNDTAIFAGLDKITAEIITFAVPVDKTVLFGTLEVTPRVCYTKPPTEPPQTTSFVEVNERQHQGGNRRLFTGWMFAGSPGLHAVEHPVYDVWLTDCRTTEESPSEPKE